MGVPDTSITWGEDSAAAQPGSSGAAAAGPTPFTAPTSTADITHPGHIAPETVMPES